MNGYQIEVARCVGVKAKKAIISRDYETVLSFYVYDDKPDRVRGTITAWAPGLDHGNTAGTLPLAEVDLASILNSIFPGKAVAA